MLIRAAISRSIEFEADRVGAGIAGSPIGLSSAPVKIEIVQAKMQMDTNAAIPNVYHDACFQKAGNVLVQHSSIDGRTHSEINVLGKVRDRRSLLYSVPSRVGKFNWLLGI